VCVCARARVCVYTSTHTSPHAHTHTHTHTQYIHVYTGEELEGAGREGRAMYKDVFETLDELFDALLQRIYLLRFFTYIDISSFIL
jgi:hypothetical protein